MESKKRRCSVDSDSNSSRRPCAKGMRSRYTVVVEIEEICLWPHVAVVAVIAVVDLLPETARLDCKYEQGNGSGRHYRSESTGDFQFKFNTTGLLQRLEGRRERCQCHGSLGCPYKGPVRHPSMPVEANNFRR